MDPLLQLLKELVEIDTVNSPEEGRKPPRDGADFIHETLRGWGIQSEVVEDGGYFTVKGQLGTDEPRVLLLSHWDVVPRGVESRWRHPPHRLTLEEDRAFGRGVVDDKGNVAAILTALPDIADRVEGGLAFAFTGDEETGGTHGAKRLAQEIHPRFLVNGDGIDLQIINRRRNYFRLHVSVPATPRRTRGEAETMRFTTRTRIRDTRHTAYFIHGVDSHAFLTGAYHALLRGLTVAGVGGGFVKDTVIPDEVSIDFVREGRSGENLVVDDNLTALLKALIPLSRIAFPTDFSVYGINALPNLYRRDGDTHHVTVDVRAMTAETGGMREAAERALHELVPAASLRVETGAGCVMTDPQAPLIQTAKEVASTLGIPPRVVERQGSSDSRHFSPQGVECIDFGPQGGNLHGPNEYVVVSTLERAAKFYAQLVSGLLGSG